MQSERERRFPGPRRGQFAFALAFVLATGFLLTQVPSETRWAANTDFFAQPRFWPAAGLVAMFLFAGLHLVKLPWKRFRRADRIEAAKWGTSLEFVAWFMAYVLLVPIVGYLPATVVFVPVLGWRLGYRSRRIMLSSILFAVATVVVFKGFLSVKIPGGMVYEYLPGAVRTFFILNL